MTTFYQKHPLLSHLGLIALTAVFLALVAMLFLDVWTDHGKTAVVPDVKGVNYQLAAKLLDESGLGIEVADSVYDANTAPGTVTESWPRPRTTVKPGRTVYVTINALSPRKVVVTTPLSDISSRQAVAYLQGLGLSDIGTEYVAGEFDDLVKGVYCGGKQLKPGSELPVTAHVTVVVTRAVQPDYSAADSIPESEGAGDGI